MLMPCLLAAAAERAGVGKARSVDRRESGLPCRRIDSRGRSPRGRAGAASPSPSAFADDFE
jgi:hypothetical protein